MSQKPPVGRATSVLSTFKNGKDKPLISALSNAERKATIKPRGLAAEDTDPRDRHTIAAATVSLPPPTRVDAKTGTASRLGVRKSEQIERALAAMTSLTEQTYAEAQMAEHLGKLIKPTIPPESMTSTVAIQEDGKSILTVVTQEANNQQNMNNGINISQTKQNGKEIPAFAQSVPADYRDILLNELAAHKAVIEKQFKFRESQRVKELDAVREELEVMAVKVYEGTLAIAKQSKELEERERAVSGHRMKITAEYERHMAEQTHKHKVIVDSISLDKEQLNASLREKEVALQQALQRLTVMEKEYDSLQAHMGRFQKKDDQNSLAVDSAKEDLRVAQETIKNLQGQYSDAQAELAKARKEAQESDSACKYYLAQLRECVARYQSLEQRVAASEAARFEQERAELSEKTRRFEADKQLALATGGHGDSLRPSSVLADQLIANLNITNALKSKTALMFAHEGGESAQTGLSAADIAYATGDDVSLLKEMVKEIQSDIKVKEDKARQLAREEYRQQERDKAAIIYAAGYAHPLANSQQSATNGVRDSTFTQPKDARQRTKRRQSLAHRATDEEIYHSDVATQDTTDIRNGYGDGKRRPSAYYDANRHDAEGMNAPYESRSGTATNGSLVSDDEHEFHYKQHEVVSSQVRGGQDRIRGAHSGLHRNTPLPTSPLQQMLDISISTMSSYNEAMGPTAPRGETYHAQKGTQSYYSDSSSGDRTQRTHLAGSSPLQTTSASSDPLSSTLPPVQMRNIADSSHRSPQDLHNHRMADISHQGRPLSVGANSVTLKTRPVGGISGELVVSGTAINLPSRPTTASSRPSSAGSNISSARKTSAGVLSIRVANNSLTPANRSPNRKEGSSPFQVSPNTTVTVSPLSSVATPSSVYKRTTSDTHSPSTTASGRGKTSQTDSLQSKGEVTQSIAQLKPFVRHGPLGPFTLASAMTGGRAVPTSTETSVSHEVGAPQAATDSVASFLESVKASKAQILATGGYTEEDDLIKQMTQKIETYTKFLESGRFQ